MAVAIRYCERYPYPSEQYDQADEHWHQVCFMEFVRLNYPGYYTMLFAIPNGGTRNRVEAANMKMEGVKAGIPDTFLSLPQRRLITHWPAQHEMYCGLYIEMKRPTGSYGVSDKQAEFMANARACGYATGVGMGWWQAVGIFLYYIGGISEQKAAEWHGVTINAYTFGNGIEI